MHHLRELTPEELREVEELRRELGPLSKRPAGVSIEEWEDRQRQTSNRLGEILRTAEERAQATRVLPPQSRLCGSSRVNISGFSGRKVGMR